MLNRPFAMNLRSAVFSSLFASLLATGATAADKPIEKISPDQLAFFEKKIRPVLVA